MEQNLIYRLHKALPDIFIAFGTMDYDVTHIIYILTPLKNNENHIMKFYLSGCTYDVEDGKRKNNESVGFSAGKTEDEMFEEIMGNFK